MLQVLNSNERRQAFIKFLLFFLATVAAVVAAVYFNFVQVPKKRNELLTQNLNELQTENNRQKEFITVMQDARKLLDSLNSPGASIAQVEMKLNGRLRDLSSFPQNDSTLYGKMNKNIVELFLDLQTAKTDMTRTREALAELERAKAELRDTKADLDRCRALAKETAIPSY